MTVQAAPLIQSNELQEERSAPVAPLLIDLRPAEQFVKGLIPGAVHLDLWGLSLIDTSPAPLRAFMWMIGHLFALRGVSPDRPVVVYEKDSGMRAARAFWFLEYLGHPNVRVLDGGIDAWTAAGLRTTTEASAPVAGHWHGSPDANYVATWQDVRAALEQPRVCLLDTRSDAEYFGQTVRAKRGGAIPGAVHFEWTNNLAPDGRYKAPDELRQMYAAIGVTPDRDVITYCQGGYRAAHSYLALRILDFPRVRNYTGSWKEWGDREDLPIEQPQKAMR